MLENSKGSFAVSAFHSEKLQVPDENRILHIFFCFTIITSSTFCNMIFHATKHIQNNCAKMERIAL